MLLIFYAFTSSSLSTFFFLFILLILLISLHTTISLVSQDLKEMCMQAGGLKKVYAGGDTVHLTLSAFEQLLDLLGERTDWLPVTLCHTLSALIYCLPLTIILSPSSYLSLIMSTPISSFLCLSVTLSPPASPSSYLLLTSSLPHPVSFSPHLSLILSPSHLLELVTEKIRNNSFIHLFTFFPFYPISSCATQCH